MVPNPKGGRVGMARLQSSRELPQSAEPQSSPRSVEAEIEPGVDSRLQQPVKTVSTKISKIDEELLKLFKKVEINILLLDAIKQIPKYAKFHKELCVHKTKKMKGIVETGGVVSSLCPDLGIFAVPCTIGGRTFTNAMLVLEASIKIMLASIYKSLILGDLEPTRIEIQLANRSVVQPLGVLKDVLVQVNEFAFQTNFYVLDIEDEASREGSALILGRPFLVTTKTKIDIHAGTLSMEFGDTYVKFNIFEVLKHPKDYSIFSIDAIDGLMEEYFRLGTGDASLVDFVNIFFYQVLVIIANNLNREQEEKLLEVLRRHKKAIGWTLADLPGINLSICMHKILLEEDARQVRKQQQRLNLTLLDVVKKEVTKLLALSRDA
ncbi:hypothetical protein CR513_17825, partial [Mucuna pruriens]